MDVWSPSLHVFFQIQRKQANWRYSLYSLVSVFTVWGRFQLLPVQISCSYRNMAGLDWLFFPFCIIYVYKIAPSDCGNVSLKWLNVQLACCS